MLGLRILVGLLDLLWNEIPLINYHRLRVSLSGSPSDGVRRCGINIDLTRSSNRSDKPR